MMPNGVYQFSIAIDPRTRKKVRYHSSNFLESTGAARPKLEYRTSKLSDTDDVVRIPCKIFNFRSLSWFNNRLNYEDFYLCFRLPERPHEGSVYLCVPADTLSPAYAGGEYSALYGNRWVWIPPTHTVIFYVHYATMSWDEHIKGAQHA